MDVIGPHIICRKGNKYFYKVYSSYYDQSCCEWSNITEYNDKLEIIITNLVESEWLTIYLTIAKQKPVVREKNDPVAKESSVPEFVLCVQG